MVFEVVSSGTIADYDKALLEFGKNSLINSIDTLKNFSQSMITLVSGLFAVYFALLQFLGITNLTNPQILMSKTVITLPPVLFIASLVAFVLAVLPLYGRMLYNSPSDIEAKRHRALEIKYAGIIAGVVLLVIALAITILVFLRL